MEKKIKFVLNNKSEEIVIDGTKRLLDILREDFKLTGPKEGCGEGECGACAVLMNGMIVNSCLVAGNAIEGTDILTIEGFSKTDRFSVLETAFEDSGAVQCGFCIPGMVMAAEALLSKNNNPTEEDIRIGISGNLCRCTGYNMIIEAIELAAKRGQGLW